MAEKGWTDYVGHILDPGGIQRGALGIEADEEKGMIEDQISQVPIIGDVFNQVSGFLSDPNLLLQEPIEKPYGGGYTIGSNMTPLSIGMMNDSINYAMPKGEKMAGLAGIAAGMGQGAYAAGQQAADLGVNAGTGLQNLGFQAAADANAAKAQADWYANYIAQAGMGQAERQQLLAQQQTNMLAGTGATIGQGITAAGAGYGQDITAAGAGYGAGLTQAGLGLGGDVSRTALGAGTGLTGLAGALGGQVMQRGSDAGMNLANYGFHAGRDATGAITAAGENIAQYGQAQGERVAGDARSEADYVKAGGAAYGQAFGQLSDRAVAAGEQFAGRATPTYDPTAQTGALDESRGQGRDLANLERTEGPSAAQAQLQQGLNQAQQTNLGMARSGTGFGESAQNFSQALDANARMGQESVNQAAMLRAQENQAWRQRQAQNLEAAAGINQTAAEQYGGQSEYLATLQQQQQKQNAGDFLSALGLGGEFRGQGASAELGAQQAGAQLQQAGLQFGTNLGLTGTTTGGELAARGTEFGTDLTSRLQQAGYGMAQDAVTAGAGLNLQGATSGAGLVTQGSEAGAGITAGLLGQGAQLGFEGAAAGGRLGYEGAVTGGQTALGALDSSVQQRLAADLAASGLGMDALSRAADVGLQGLGLQQGGTGQAADIYRSGADVQQQGLTTALSGIQTAVGAQEAGISGLGKAADLQLASIAQAHGISQQDVDNYSTYIDQMLDREGIVTDRAQIKYDMLVGMLSAGAEIVKGVGEIAKGIGEGIPL